MGVLKGWLATGVIAWATIGVNAVNAGVKDPQVGPVPAWVQDAPASPPDTPDLKALPVALLLKDSQIAIDAEGWTEFHHVRGRIQSDQGLQALGTIPFQWSPWSDTLTFHYAHILRGGETIDVLPKTGGFAVLRRETGLEDAMLTGELTAVLQPEGLQVGDVLDLAMSIRHADPLLKGRAGLLFQGFDVSPLARLRLQAHWPSTLPVRWRESAGMSPFTRTEANGVTTVALQLDNLQTPIPPAHAPQRFQHGRQVEFSTFSSWTEVAEVIRPLFEKAAELAPGSQVTEQARLIAAKFSNAKSRATAALQLVQSQVRYLAHADAAGGLTPQSADDTWKLRYGDCKAKTVLLLALLHELGVAAEPALVSTGLGDSLNVHLPSPTVFNHVVAHVSLEGRDYWLDGTRQGERNLEDFGAEFGWVLPMGPGGGRLVKVSSLPSPRPDTTQVIRYDGSKGVAEPVGTHFETVFRNALGAAIHAQISSVPPERTNAALKTYWAQTHSAFTPTTMTTAWDAAKGEETFIADGASKLEWSNGLELQHVALGGAPDITRDPASQDLEAPYTVAYPSWLETDESVVLPPGVTVPAAVAAHADLDITIAGVAYRRSGTMSGAVFRVVTSQKALVSEITAAEARASVEPLKQMASVTIYAPANPLTITKEDAASLSSRPLTADGHVSRGRALFDASLYREAVAEFDAAIALNPSSQMAWANRGQARAWLSDPAATADADKADSLGTPEVLAARTRALLAMQKKDNSGARAALLQALSRSANDELSLRYLIELENNSGDQAAAQKHADQLAKAHPEAVANDPIWRAGIERAAHHNEAAKAALASFTPSNARQYFARALNYQALDAMDLAKADAAAATRIEPTAANFMQRARVDGGFIDPAAEADVDQALKIDPNDQDAILWKSNAAGARRDYATAVVLLSRLIEANNENLGEFLLGRARFQSKLGHNSDMDADFVRARALVGATAPRADSLCRSEASSGWRPETALEDCEAALRAMPESVTPRLWRVIVLAGLGRPSADTDKVIDEAEKFLKSPAALNDFCYNLGARNVRLDRALALCDASLKLAPNTAHTLDSRAFVLLRMGRDADALSAYNAALAVEPALVSALYGRGLVMKRLGREVSGDRDVKEAERLRPRIESDFIEMGVTR